MAITIFLDYIFVLFGVAVRLFNEGNDLCKAMRECLEHIGWQVSALSPVLIEFNHLTRLKLLGAKEAAIEALESHVIDPSQEQSTTAVLEKISGAGLIAARQRQARTQFIAGIVEQLLIDTKRARDTEANAINMQLTTWREGRAANEAFAAGTGESLRTWKQP